MAEDKQRIIAWLKHHERTGGEMARFYARQFREGIERGDHLKGSSRG